MRWSSTEAFDAATDGTGWLVDHLSKVCSGVWSGLRVTRNGRPFSSMFCTFRNSREWLNHLTAKGKNSGSSSTFYFSYKMRLNIKPIGSKSIFLMFHLMLRTNMNFISHKLNTLVTWSTLSQYVKHTLLPLLPRKFHALHAAGFWGIKVLSRCRKISLPIESWTMIVHWMN